jgi:hypothetical protein
VCRSGNLDPRAAAGGQHHNRGMLSKTPHLTRLGRASSARRGICHQLIPEQKRRPRPDENLPNPAGPPFGSGAYRISYQIS